MTTDHLAQLIMNARTEQRLGRSDVARRTGLATEIVACVEDASRIHTVSVGDYHLILAALHIHPTHAQAVALMSAETGAVEVEILKLAATLWQQGPEKFYRFLGYGEALVEQMRDEHETGDL